MLWNCCKRLSSHVNNCWKILCENFFLSHLPFPLRSCIPAATLSFEECRDGRRKERTNCLQLISPCFDTRHYFMFLAVRRKVSETNHFGAAAKTKKCLETVESSAEWESFKEKKFFFSLYISWPAKTKFIVDWLLIYGEVFFPSMLFIVHTCLPGE